MSRRLRLFAAAAPFALAAAPALAQTEVTGDTTDPVATSTINDGAPDDITIVSGAALQPGDADLDANRAAVTLDSDNAVLNLGLIAVEDVSGTSDRPVSGILVLGGTTGSVTNDGSIRLVEDFSPTDDDDDGDFDGPFATGSNRVGILIEGATPFAGSITNTSSGTITVEGNSSAGVRATTALDGDFSNSGLIAVTGNDSFALDLQDGVSGDVTLNGSLSARGENSVAASIQGDVGGAITVGGTVTSSGYRETARRTDDSFRASLDEDDLLQGGPALAIGGDVAGGLLLNGPFEGNDANARSNVISFGGAPTLLISASWDATRTSDVVIGPVADADGFGFVARGTVQGIGVNDDVAGYAVRIEGGTGTRAIINGGVNILGGISAQSIFNDSTGLELRSGAETPVIAVNAFSSVTASTQSDGVDPAASEAAVNDGVGAGDGVDTATAIALRSGSSLTGTPGGDGLTAGSLINDGLISALTTGSRGDAFAILDESGTLVLVENTGSILAQNILDEDSLDSPGRTVAISMAENTAGATVIQSQRAVTDTNEDGDLTDEIEPAAPVILGDVLFGSGNDTFDVRAGEVTGDIDFGAGDDTLSITGGAQVSGGIANAGGLDIAVLDGLLAVTSPGAVNLTTLEIGADGQLSVVVDGTGETLQAAQLFADTVTIADGATIAPVLSGIALNDITVDIITAAAGGLTAPADIAAVATNDVPFLYEASLDREAGSDVITLSLTRRSASDLGLNENQANSLDVVLAALSTDEELGSALANTTTQESFTSALEQFYPDYTDASIQLLLAGVNGSIGAVSNRLDVVRSGRGAGAVWVQEYATYQDRENDGFGPGYRGHGFGFAAGMDRPFGPFYAVGVNLAGAASQWEEPSGFDEPRSVRTLHAGVYAASAAGPLRIDAFGGAGVDQYETVRRFSFDDISREASADWAGYHANASLRAALEFNRGAVYFSPQVSVDYLRLEEEGYTETGGGAGFDLEVDERTSESFTSTAMLVAGGRFGREGRTWWSPRLRVGYRANLSSEAPVTVARFVGTTDTFALTASDMPDSGGIAGFTFAAGSRYSSFQLDYDADIADGFLRHVARVAFRFVF